MEQNKTPVAVEMTLDGYGGVIVHWLSPNGFDDEELYNIADLVDNNSTDFQSIERITSRIQNFPTSIIDARNLQIRDYMWRCGISWNNDVAKSIFTRLAMLEIMQYGWSSDEVYKAFAAYDYGI